MNKNNKKEMIKKMCECDKRFDELKKAMSFILDEVCDLFTSVTDESADFYEGMGECFEGYKRLIEAI